PPAPSASRQRSRSSPGANRHQRSSQRASAGSSYLRSSVVSLRLALSNPTLPENTGDHRYAARSLQHLEGALASGFASPSYTTRRDTIAANDVGTDGLVDASEAHMPRP